MTLSVEPSGVGGNLSLAKSSALYAYRQAAKDEEGSLSTLAWDLPNHHTLITWGNPTQRKTVDDPPGTVYLEGRELDAATACCLTYTWGAFSLADTVHTRVEVVPPPKIAIRLFTVEKDELGAYYYEQERYHPVGGLMEPVLEVRLDPHERIVPDAQPLFLRIADIWGYSANAFAISDGRVEWTNAENWYHLDGGTWTNGQLPTAVNESTTPIRFRYSAPIWNTRHYPSVTYAVASGTTTEYLGFNDQPMGHNGKHRLSLVTSDECRYFTGYTIALHAQATGVNFQLQEGEAPYPVTSYTPAAKIATVKNLVVSAVTAKHGTVDYLKYDPDPSSPYNRPQVKFTVDDSGNHGITPRYRYWALIQPTFNSGKEFVDLMNVYGYCYGEVASAWAFGGDYYARATTLTWDGSVVNHYDKASNTVEMSDPDTADWGTYTYDVIADVENSETGELLDLFAFKWPYCLSISNDHENGHKVWIKSYSQSDELRCYFKLSDYVHVNSNTYPNYTIPHSITLIPMGGDLNELNNGVISGNIIGQLYSENTDDGILLATSKDLPGVNRAIFIGVDTCWTQYRRDHEDVRMIAVNDKTQKDPYLYMKLFRYDGLFQRMTQNGVIRSYLWTPCTIGSITVGQEDKKVALIIHGIHGSGALNGKLDPDNPNEFSLLAEHLSNDSIITNNMIRKKYSKVYFLNYPSGKYQHTGPNYNYAPEEVGNALSRVIRNITALTVNSKKEPTTFQKIDVFAHSQGGVLTRYAMKYGDGNGNQKADECILHFTTLCSPHLGVSPIPSKTDQYFNTYLTLYNRLPCGDREKIGLWSNGKFINTLNMTLPSVDSHYIAVGGTKSNDFPNGFLHVLGVAYTDTFDMFDRIYGGSDKYDGFVGTNSAIGEYNRYYNVLSSELVNSTYFTKGIFNVNHYTVYTDVNVFKFVDQALLAIR